MKSVKLLILILGLTINSANSQKLVLDKWKYIEADSSRQKWGDWAEPDWLRYFGLDILDLNIDGYKDIISGRYFYLNPGGDMEEPWVRSDLGMNVDGYLFVDIDGDEFADVIAEALPDVYWFEADNWKGSSWTCRKIGEIPRTDHVNGQGGLHSQIISGNNEEIILATEGGIYAAEIPDHPEVKSDWKFIRIIRTGSSEGIGAGDIDGDGDIDLAAGDMFIEDKDVSRQLFWHENPGSLNKEWVKHHTGTAVNAIDRIEIADFNGDGKADIAVSEEMWPGFEPLANLLIFTNPGKDYNAKWDRGILFTGYSINNLDAGDIDRDGDTDLITCEHKGKEFRLLLFENDGRGKFTMHLADRGHESHLGALLADLDSDGDPDLVSIAWDAYKFLHIWRNDAIQKSIRWEHLSSINGDLPSPNGGHEQTSCLVADLDKDGIKDFIITDRSVSPSVVWYRLIEGNGIKLL
ncbi:MAG: VCBS repeat-containing protein [Bacteroidales bacterium]|nr:VCBS repeat-containing protein [Bacteroidales bacterium]